VAAHERDGSIVVAGRQFCQQGFVGRAPHTVKRSDGLPRIARNPDDPASRISCRVHRATGEHMRTVLSGLFVIVTALGVTACGDDDDSGGTATSAAGSATTAASGGGQANTVKVTVSGSAFHPTTAEANAGVVDFDVTNEDGVSHTFTIDDTDVDIALDPNGSGTAETQLEAGTYQWHCSIHSSMTGALTVA
jgi:plastocyanin